MEVGDARRVVTFPKYKIDSKSCMNSINLYGGLFNGLNLSKTGKHFLYVPWLVLNFYSNDV